MLFIWVFKKMRFNEICSQLDSNGLGNKCWKETIKPEIKLQLVEKGVCGWAKGNCSAIQTAGTLLYYQDSNVKINCLVLICTAFKFITFRELSLRKMFSFFRKKYMISNLLGVSFVQLIY